MISEPGNEFLEKLYPMAIKVVPNNELISHWRMEVNLGLTSWKNGNFKDSCSHFIKAWQSSVGTEDRALSLMRFRSINCYDESGNLKEE